MATRLKIDPVTRIEGHLRVDVEVEGGVVNDAWACCTMWRGIEAILKQRDSREAWLFAQRFCGVCTTVHAMASVRAVEDAIKLEIPNNAQYIRNMILVAHALHDHIVHFYHLSALDWVDITTIPKADPKKTSALAESLSEWPMNSTNEMRRVQKQAQGLLDSGQLGIFANGYWGHPAMKLSPEVNLLAFAHYFQALEIQRKANQIVATLGSKSPHIQNLAVGGVMNAINTDSLATLNMDRLYSIKTLLDEVRTFVEQVYFPDVCAIAAFYPEWFEYGAGVTNYLAAPDLPLDGYARTFDLPGGVVTAGNAESLRTFSSFADDTFRKGVTEDSTHAWYRHQGPEHPWQGTTEPKFTKWDEKGKYTWVKSPRFEGEPMQVGPLADIIVGYAAKHPLTVEWTDRALKQISAIANKEFTIDHMHSTMGRYVARMIRTCMLADLGPKHWQLLADNILSGDLTIYNRPVFPYQAVEGVGVHEAPRGTLSHWVVVEDGMIKNYQAVVPTTWNASPRDQDGKPGPYEQSLVNNPVADSKQPLEVLRTVHSFDPCMACACHTFDPSGQRLSRTKIV